MRKVTKEMALDINFRIAAFDPGGTTGWATYSALWIPGLPHQNIRWDCGQIGPEKHHMALEQLLGLQQVQHYIIVCERFTDRVTEHHVDLMAREYIGIIEAFCESRKVPLVMQMSSAAKNFTKNPNLKSLGLWSGAEWKHAMDARRHLLWFIVNSAEAPRHMQDIKRKLLTEGWPNK